jgi:hypothetical protein
VCIWSRGAVRPSYSGKAIRFGSRRIWECEDSISKLESRNSADLIVVVPWIDVCRRVPGLNTPAGLSTLRKDKLDRP